MMRTSVQTFQYCELLSTINYNVGLHIMCTYNRRNVNSSNKIL